jgi:hypothetical protein
MQVAVADARTADDLATRVDSRAVADGSSQRAEVLCAAAALPRPGVRRARLRAGSPGDQAIVVDALRGAKRSAERATFRAKCINWLAGENDKRFDPSIRCAAL